MLFCFLAVPGSRQEFRSLTRDQTCTPCSGGAEEVPSWSFLTGGREAVCQGAESPQGFTEQMGQVWVSWGAELALGPHSRVWSPWASLTSG